MDDKVRSHLDETLNHLYINPLEKCNLKCKICYTRKTDPILTQEQMVEFIKRYRQSHKLQTITFCGGEVFALKYFPELINTLTSDGIFIQTITNGTIDRLDAITTPNMVNLIVSLDGLKDFHDANRGEGNFNKSLNFLKKAKALGFHKEIFSIITHQNLPHIDEFENYLNTALQEKLNITYHPRKPPTYLLHNPNSNIFGETKGFDFLTKQEMRTVMHERNTFPPKDLGCYQIALTSDGRVFGCCEGVRPIGTIRDPIPTLIEKMSERIEKWETTNKWEKCLGCTDHTFMCGIKEYMAVLHEKHHTPVAP
jgi:MoaA/NifB/PqqE/SkfB family radical SAM enzyme